MALSRSDPRRAACEDLARLLETADGLHEARLLQLLGTFVPPASALPAPAAEPEAVEARLTPIPIGAWLPQEIDGQLMFVRPNPPALDDPWDPVKTLAPKASPLPVRVCLLGESTAAGWCYAPHLTPARVLEDQLRALKGPGSYEVLNLTRADLGARELAELALAALQLKPDLLVVFAGNNWPVRYKPARSINPELSQKAALTYRENGVRGLARSARQATLQTAEAIVARLARLAQSAGIPVVLIVPAVGLTNWDRARPVTWLPGAASARWHAVRQQALRWLSTGAYQEAATAAREMIELDAGTCATSHRILANALLALGRADEALAACGDEVDARSWDNLPSVPGATSAVREVLRRAASEHGLRCVDLSAVFREHGGLAGQAQSERRLLLDYCHLTPQGMKLAMAAVAVELLALFAGPAAPAADGETTLESLLTRLPDPDVPADVDAHAKFMTGLYHAHWNTREGEAEYWFNQSLKAWSGIRDTMLAYVATRAAPADTLLLSAEQQSISRNSRPMAHRVWNVPHLDGEVIELIGGVLAGSGRPAPAELGARQLAHHGVGERGVNLLDPFFRWSLQDLYATGGGFEHDRFLYYRAQWPASHFCFVADGAAPVVLELTGRLQFAAKPRRGEVAVLVNGERRGIAKLGPRWSRHRITVGRRSLRTGVNRVTLEWPPLASEGDEATREIGRRLDQGLPTQLHPVFGELSELVVRTGRKRPAAKAR